MLKVGPFIFSLSTAAHQALTRSDQWRWVTHDRLGNELHSQYLGPGERTITLDGVVFTTFDAGRAPFSNSVVGLKQIDALRGLGDTGSPLTVTDGMGNHFGKWVVLAVNERQQVFFSDGAPKVQEFDITLRFYGEGRSGGGALGFGGLGLLAAGAALFAGASALSGGIGATIRAGDAVKAEMSAAGVTLGVAL